MYKAPKLRKVLSSLKIRNPESNTVTVYFIYIIEKVGKFQLVVARNYYIIIFVVRLYTQTRNLSRIFASTGALWHIKLSFFNFSLKQ